MARKVAKSYELLTGGKDHELDVLGVCCRALDELHDGVEIKRILDYLVQRHTYTGNPEAK